MHPEPTPAGTVGGFDHVALPMHDPVAMTRFYRSLGLQVTETPHLVQVYVGDQMINFHRPDVWQQEGFTLRAPAAMPPCGDLCFVWDGSTRSLKEQLDRAGADVIEGPVERQGDSSGRPARASTCAIPTATSWNSSSTPRQASMADLIIRGGTVFDGTGAPGRRAFFADAAIGKGVIEEDRHHTCGAQEASWTLQAAP